MENDGEKQRDASTNKQENREKVMGQFLLSNRQDKSQGKSKLN